jgi:hypothetical protein
MRFRQSWCSLLLGLKNYTPFYEANGFLGYDDFMEPAQQFGMAEEIVAAFLLSLPSKESAAYDLIERSFLSDAAKARYRRIFADRLLAIRPRGTGLPHIRPHRCCAV